MTLLITNKNESQSNGLCSLCKTRLRDRSNLKPLRGDWLCVDCYREESAKAFNAKTKITERDFWKNP